MVPAKGGPQAVSDLIAGQVDLYFGNASELLPHINSDRIRLIAAGTAQRLAAAPDLPTVAETLPGFEFSSWNGFFAPAGTPEAIISAIRQRDHYLGQVAEISGASVQARHRSRRPGTDETEDVFRKDREAFAAAIKAAGIPPPQ